MIWIVCRGCGAEECIDKTDGNAPECVKAIDAGVRAFAFAHVACGHIALRDSYGRTYEMRAPIGGPS
jgi:hypothetical protein